MNADRLQRLEVLLGHAFRDRSFLINALSHSSIKNEQRPSNERLEFLGDSVLGMVISHALYARFPDSDEGTLTRIKSQAVSRATLQRVAEAMGLDRYILVGKGVAKREIPGSLLGNLYEALVGAIYLDAGLAAGRKFIMRHLDVVIDEIINDRAEKNYKSLLQHHCQRELGSVPMYRVLREGGPAHGRHFDVSVVVGGQEVGRARAASKKEAEQGAARAAMIHYGVVDENPNTPTRGAGTILRVGEGTSPRKKRSRRGGAGRRRSADAAPEAAPDVAANDGPPHASAHAPAHAPGQEKTSSRRRKRGGRGRRGGGGGGQNAPDRADAPSHDERPARNAPPTPSTPPDGPVIVTPELVSGDRPRDSRRDADPAPPIKKTQKKAAKATKKRATKTTKKTAAKKTTKKTTAKKATKKVAKKATKKKTTKKAAAAPKSDAGGADAPVKKTRTRRGGRRKKTGDSAPAGE